MQRLSRHVIMSLAVFSYFSVANATEWLIHTESSFEGESLLQANSNNHIEEIYRFKSGESLWLADDAHVDLSALFSAEEVNYLLPNYALETHSPTENSLRHEYTHSANTNSVSPFSSLLPSVQNGFRIAGFEQLSESERQCDRSRIAVLDSGVDTLHSNFSQVQFVDPYNAITDSDNASDEFGHGTHVTGILAANHHAVVQGACSSATVMPIRFLTGTGGGTVADAIKGIDWAIAHSADIINHSWSILSYSQPLYDALLDANERGIIQVAAAGNSNYDVSVNPSYPASFSSDIPLLISIGNYDANKQAKGVTSNFGWSSVDIAAPGTMIESLAPNNQTRVESGTSMAAPWVSAALAVKKQIAPAALELSQHNEATVASLLQVAATEPGLLGYVRDGKRLDVSQITEEMVILPHVLSLERQSDVIVLKGYALDTVSEVWFQSAKVDSQPVQLEFNQKNPSTIQVPNWDLTAGWFELHTHNGKATQYGYSPDVPAPRWVASLPSDNGNMITWSGNDYVDEYIIYKKRNGRFYELATIDAPSNQYRDERGIASDLYKIRSRYQTVVGARQVEMKSSMSQVSINSEAAWNTNTFANIPVGSMAQLPIFSEHNNAEFMVLEDDANLVRALHEHVLHIDTTHSANGTIQIKEINSGDIISWALTISEVPQWHITYNESLLTLFDIEAQVHSLQLLDDHSLHITGEWLEDTATLQLVLDDPSWQFGSASLKTAELSDDVGMVTSTKTVTLQPKAPFSSATFDVTLQFDLESQVQPSASSDSRCFIATSLYPDDEAKLMFFREVRDKVLLQVPLGEDLVDWYYASSPVWVERSEETPLLKNMLRFGLDVLWLLFHFPYQWLIVASVCIFVPYYRWCR